MSEIEAGKFHLKSNKSISRGWQILDRWKTKQEQNGDVWKQISERPLECYINETSAGLPLCRFRTMISQGTNFCTKPSVRTKNARKPGYQVFFNAIMYACVPVAMVTCSVSTEVSLRNFICFGTETSGYLLCCQREHNQDVWYPFLVSVPLRWPWTGTLGGCVLATTGPCSPLHWPKHFSRTWQFEKAQWAFRAPQKGNAELILSEDIRSEMSWKKWFSYWYKP